MNRSEANSGKRTRRASGFGWLIFALLVWLLLVLGRTALPVTVGEQARQIILKRLQEQYTRLDISIGRGEYRRGVGFVFEDIRIADPEFDGDTTEPIVKIDRLLAMTDMDWQRLADRSNPIVTQQIIIDGGHVTIDRNAKGEWSPQRLLPMPVLGPVCPRIDVHGVQVKLVNRQSPSRSIDARIDNLAIRSTHDRQGNVIRRVRMKASSHFTRTIEMSVESGPATLVSLRLRGAHLNADLMDRLPTHWATACSEFRGLDCVTDLRVDARRIGANVPSTMNSASSFPIPEDWEFWSELTVNEGQFSHPDLPVPVKDLRGKLSIDRSGLRIESAHGVLGDAICRVDGKVDALAWPADADLHVDVDGLMLDRRLAAALPDKLRPLWQRLQPHGRLDLDGRFRHHDDRWTSSAILRCKGIDVRIDKFPYPATELTGEIRIENDRAVCQRMSARVGGQGLQCRFSLPTREGAGRPFSFAGVVDRPMPIDEALLSSLTPRGEATSKLERFVRSLEPGGSVHLVRVALSRDGEGRLHRDIDLRVADGRLNYEKFRYPLFNVHGTIQVVDREVRINNFRAHHPSGGLVRCLGTFLMPNPPAAPRIERSPQSTDSRLELLFAATDLPMDEALRLALPVSSRRTWDALSPSGVLDHLAVQLQRIGESPLTMDVTARQDRAARVASRTLSLRPQALPYRLDITGGAVHFDGKAVRISDLQGRHDESRLVAAGSCAADASGRWRLALDILGGSRLTPDAQLIASLPRPMSQTMRRLQLRGPVGVRGSAEVLLPREQDDAPVIDWDIVMQLEGNRIGDVGPVHSMRGEISTAGRHDGTRLRAAGEVALDSLHIDDLQVARLRGPFTIDDDRLRLGQSVGSYRDVTGQPVAAGPIRGVLFDGDLDINGDARLSASEFDVQLAMNDAKVPTMLADLGHADQGLTGTISGQARLTGVLGDFERLEGYGQAQMTEANIYRLPLIIQIFNQLRISPTEDVAITHGDCRFTLDGRDVHFSELRLGGDLVELSGGGQVHRGRDLNLTFNTRVSRNNLFTKLSGPFRDSPYTLWTIDVTGPIGSQTIQRRALDNLGDTLEMLFPGIDSQADGSSRHANSTDNPAGRTSRSGTGRGQRR